jgi:hypothetical protein
MLLDRHLMNGILSWSAGSLSALSDEVQAAAPNGQPIVVALASPRPCHIHHRRERRCQS